MKAVLALSLFVGCAAACAADAPARPEWKVYLATDAPVPQFGDEVIVDVLDGSADPPEQFFDASTPGSWPISFGVVPADPSVPVRIRARLFRFALTGSDGLPTTSSLIDGTATLPPPSGLTAVALTLSMSCFGLAADVNGRTTCDPTAGALAPEPTLSPVQSLTGLPAPGSWAPAAKVDCRGAVPAGMVCVSGGAFLLGSPRYLPIDATRDPTPEHLVELSPFALDTNEFTVGAFRQLILHDGLPAPLMADPDFDAPTGACTYVGSHDSASDAMPVNCISHAVAAQACALVGKRLPTEAEWEYASGNLAAETPYPWGQDSNACTYAVVGHGSFINSDEAYGCETPANGFSVGIVPGGDPLDRTQLGITNLGGNVSEWVADLFSPYTGSCWNRGSSVGTASPVLVDPACGVDFNGEKIDFSYRGGSWSDAPDEAAGYFRFYGGDEYADSTVGFRCALSM